MVGYYVGQNGEDPVKRIIDGNQCRIRSCWVSRDIYVGKTGAVSGT